jgi:2-oxo-3-hexenedioate decarboxylase
MGENLAHSIDWWATELTSAGRDNRAAPRPTSSMTALDLDDAYAIQKETIALREAGGEQVRAIKLGLARQSDQDRWAIPHPTFGTLTDGMLLNPGEAFSRSRGHAPKIEAEIVVVLAQSVTIAPNTLADLLPAIGQVYAGIEILDSRYWEGEFHPLDAVADNQSALSGVWSREGRSLESYERGDDDLADESVEVFINNHPVATGHSSAILGNPLKAVFGVVVDRLSRGIPVPAGLAVFSGNLLDEGIPVDVGDSILARYATLGGIRLDIVA